MQKHFKKTVDNVFKFMKKSNYMSQKEKHRYWGCLNWTEPSLLVTPPTPQLEQVNRSNEKGL